LDGRLWGSGLRGGLLDDGVENICVNEPEKEESLEDGVCQLGSLLEKLSGLGWLLLDETLHL
jgi:hypothetical protein